MIKLYYCTTPDGHPANISHATGVSGKIANLSRTRGGAPFGRMTR